MSEATPKTLLFVCTGNTCRSPMAERLMADRCKNLPGWTFSSAGIFADAGAPPSPPAVEALREVGIDLTGHRARPVTPALIRDADLILAMTQTHSDLLTQIDPAAANKTRTLHSYGSEKPGADIMDPFGGGIDTYRIARDEITSALTEVILAVIRPSTPSQPL
jgi:protein-tyrosine phosphatase